MKQINIGIQSLLYMSVVQLCNAGELPKGLWRKLHVVPIVRVEIPTQCSRNDSRIDQVEPRYYALLSQNNSSSYSNTNWDALVANRSAVQPTKIFGSTSIGSANREIDIFMKTIFNTLEMMTKNNKWFGSKSLYTRKDYQYYYQPSYMIPPTYVTEKNDCFTFVSLLGKKPDYFLDLTTTWMLRQVRLWSNTYKSAFKWVEISKLLNVPVPDYSETVIVDGMEINRLLPVALQKYWVLADKELLTMEKGYQANFNSQRVARYETDLNEQLAKQAGESWLTFADAIYFNDNTPTYGALGLNSGGYPFVVDQNRYDSLHDFRIKNLTTEPTEKINAVEDLRLVYDALKAKIERNPEFKNLLKSTGTLPLIYANRVNKKDRFYGIGSDARGENHLGKMLMTIRKNVDNPPTKYNPAYDYLAVLKNPIEGSGLVAAKEANLATATANLLWYRAAGRLPSSAKLTPAGGTRTLVKPGRQIKEALEQGEQHGSEQKQQQGKPDTEGELVRSSVTGEPNQYGIEKRYTTPLLETTAEKVPQITTAPQLTPEEQAKKQVIIERMRKQFESKKTEEGAGVGTLEEKKNQ